MEQNGYDAIVLLFSEKPTDNLASVRHSVLKRRFFSATNFVTPERFPLLRQQHNSTPWDATTKSWHGWATRPIWMHQTGVGSARITVSSQCSVLALQPPDSIMKAVHCNCQTACTSRRICFVEDMGYPASQLMDRVKLNHVKTLSTHHQTWILTSITLINVIYNYNTGTVFSHCTAITRREFDVTWHQIVFNVERTQ